MAYFGDEKHSIDCIVEYIGPDKTVHGVVKESAPMCHKYSNVL